MMRVLLAGGGSGGSAAPVIAVAEELRALDPEVELLYLGTSTGPEAALVRTADIPFRSIHAGRLRRYATWRNLTDPGLVLVGMAEASRLARRFRPDVAFGAGGFATVAPLLAARLHGAPIVIHQQDVLPGLANRMLAPFARWATVAFPETAAAFRSPRVRVVGNPVRRSVLEGDPDRARQVFGLAAGRPVVLVTGGGTGALRLNLLAHEAARELVHECEVIHLAGAGKRIERWTHPAYHQVDFLTQEMADVLAVADVVVTRAGMSALSELAALEKPAIVVPMPHSHQEANAAAIRRHRAGIVVGESGLTPASLGRMVHELLADPGRRGALARAARQLLAGDAAERIAALLRDLAMAPPRSVRSRTAE